MTEDLHISEFDYELPAHRIAQHPIEPRDAARLLVDRGRLGPAHLQVTDLPSLLGPGDLLVVNETKVLPVRLHLQRASGGAVEVLLLEPVDPERRRWEAMARPGRRLRPGEALLAPDGQSVLTVEGRAPGGDTFIMRLEAASTDRRVEQQGASNGGEDPEALLARHGEMPLPPYITERLEDPDRYQTVYARVPGSAAAPTAGLHFTDRLLAEITAAGVRIEPVELGVGLDTFRPMSGDDPRAHVMHSERYRVPPATWEACQVARRVIAVGTTVVRTLESAAATGSLEGRTDLFISRGFPWQVVDLMMTNFHMPRTTLLVMIDAFIGPRWKDLYAVALASDYRFLSFGDAMLLDRRAN